MSTSYIHSPFEVGNLYILDISHNFGKNSSKNDSYQISLSFEIMANSHLPNCHPDITPDWQDLDYPRTNFEQAIALEPVQGEQGCYAGFAPKDWCTPRMSSSLLPTPDRRVHTHNS